MRLQFPLEESSFRSNRNSPDDLQFWPYCISFLHVSGFYGNLNIIKSNKHARKEYDKAKMFFFNLDSFPCKKKKLLTEDSFEHSLPFGGFSLPTSGLRDQCQGEASDRLITAA